MIQAVLGGLLGTLIVFLIAWIIDSIPVWIAAKFFSDKDSFPRAMIATLLGVIVFAVLSAIFTVGLAVFIGPLAAPLGLLIGFLGLLFVFKSIFDVGWLGAFGIAVLSIVVIVIIEIILGILGVGIPLLFHHFSVPR